MSDRALHLVLGWSQHLSGNDQLNESFQAPDLASNTELSGGESMEESEFEINKFVCSQQR